MESKDSRVCITWDGVTFYVETDASLEPVPCAICGAHGARESIWSRDPWCSECIEKAHKDTKKDWGDGWGA